MSRGAPAEPGQPWGCWVFPILWWGGRGEVAARVVREISVYYGGPPAGESGCSGRCPTPAWWDPPNSRTSWLSELSEGMGLVPPQGAHLPLS